MKKTEIAQAMSTVRQISRDLYPIHLDSIPERGLREGRYEIGFARTTEELETVLRLRFEIFNLEMNEGLEESYETGLDEDPFDAVCHHLVVREVETGEIVGSYRLQTAAMAEENLGFYSAGEYVLDGLGEEMLEQAIELGRACVAKEHRNTQVLFLLWKGLALYVAHNQKRFFFGCSSLTSQDPREGVAMMSYLENQGYVHEKLRVVPRAEYLCELEPGQENELPKIGKKDVPNLFRVYLRHGAKVCSPPAIDREFKTIDFLVLFDVDAMPRRMYRTFFS